MRTLFVLVSLVSSAASAAPVVLWASDPVRPGETALVFGEGFERTTSVEIVRLDDGPPGVPPPPGSVVARGESIAVEPIQPRPRSVKFTIPASLRMGIYACRIRTPEGETLAVLNRPCPLWLIGDEGPDATPDGEAQLFGRCLSLPGRLPSFLLRGSAGSVPARAEPPGGGHHSSQWSARATLPSDLKPGRYQLYAHNGYGGSAGWSAPVELVVRPRSGGAGRYVDVHEFGARGDGRHDDTAAVQAALAKAREMGGAVVHFPRGCYLLTETLEVPPGTSLRGETGQKALDGLSILAWPEFTKPPEFLIHGKKGFELENLTLYCTNYVHIVGNDIEDPEAGNVTLRDVRIRGDAYRGHLTPEQVAERLKDALRYSTGGGDTVRLGGRNIQIRDCDLYGSGRVLYLHRARGARIEGNRLYNGRWGWYCFSGSDGVVFERNEVIGADLMATGGGINCLDGSTCSQNVAFLDNKFRLMHGWDREAMTSDAGGGAYCGPVESATLASVQLAGDPKWGGRDWKGAALFVLDGKGMGQYRSITRTDGRQVQIDEPWAILPDKTSTVTVTMLQRDYFFIGNDFEDAGIAIQLYGMAVGCVMEGNRSSRTGGFHNFGMDYHGIQPSWFNQWLGNIIEEGAVYRGGHDNYLLAGPAHLGVFALPPRTEWTHPLTLCTIVRGNQLVSNAHIAIGGTDPHNPVLRTPLVQEVIVERNHVWDSDIGIWLRRAADGVFLRNNKFDGVADEVLTDEEIERRAAERRAKLVNLKEPVAWWKMDKAVGGVLPDESGHGFAAKVEGKVRFEPGSNKGTPEGGTHTPPEGGTTYSSTKGGYAVFDGASALRVATDDLIRFPKLTVAAWIKPDKIEGRQGIIAKRTHHAAAPFVLSVWDGGLEFEACEADNRTWSFNFRSPALIKAGVWQHVAAVVEEGKGVTLYLDGKPIASKVSDKALAQNDEDIWIGKEAWGARKEDSNIPGYFAGAIRDVRLWSRALSPDEIAALLR